MTLGGDDAGADEAPAAGTTVVEVASDAQPADTSGEASDGLAERARVRLGKIVSDIKVALKRAKKDRDVVKINCLQEKLTAVRALHMLSERAVQAIEAALLSRDDALLLSERDKLMTMLAKGERYFEDSVLCVGEVDVYAGETVLELVVDESVANVPAAPDLPDIVEGSFMAPPAASPFQ
jgi:hypothetical protein